MGSEGQALPSRPRRALSSRTALHLERGMAEAVMVQPAQVQEIRRFCCMLWWLPEQLVTGMGVAHLSQKGPCQAEQRFQGEVSWPACTVERCPLEQFPLRAVFVGCLFLCCTLCDELLEGEMMWIAQLSGAMKSRTPLIWI